MEGKTIYLVDVLTSPAQKQRSNVVQCLVEKDLDVTVNHVDEKRAMSNTQQDYLTNIIGLNLKSVVFLSISLKMWENTLIECWCVNQFQFNYVIL